MIFDIRIDGLVQSQGNAVFRTLYTKTPLESNAKGIFN
jgi:hypothetical protein